MHGPSDFYEPVITSYDYGSPISESGETGQPGLGGPNSFEVCHPVATALPETSQVELTSAYGIPKRDRVYHADVTHAC